MKIIITAANGFIGKSLVAYFKKEHEVIALVRKKTDFGSGVSVLEWDGKSRGSWADSFEHADVIINLAGKSVDCRYNEANKKAIYASRLESTDLLGKVISELKHKPELWINAASANIYRHSLTDPMTESKGEIGSGFSVDVCLKWEKAFFDFKIPGVRQIALRTAIVLGKNGGVMLPFKRLVNWGMGGKMGSGNQMFSWIHEQDVCRAIAFLIEHKSCSGEFNLSSPNPVRNDYFMKSLRKTYRIPFGIPSPKWLLEFGAKLIKTETELILKSRFVVPEKLVNAGFEFRFKEIETCLNELKQNKP